MSIIQEALKKAQVQIKAEKPDDRPTSVMSKTDTAVKSHAADVFIVSNRAPDTSKRDIKFLALLIFLLTATSVAAVWQLSPRRSTVANRDKDSASQIEGMYLPADDRKNHETANLASSEAFPSLKGLSALDLKGEKQLKFPDYALNGIMYIEGAPRAIVNNAMVEIGDSVDGAKVLKINKRSVVLQHNDVEITLNIK